MVELVTNRITASALWIPEAWGRRGFTEQEIETKVVHAVQEGGDGVRLNAADGQTYFFSLIRTSLECKANSYESMIEINVYTLDTMTRYYVSLTGSL
jgi:hypothetical protein